jgi:arylsulfatase A-like enzyme
LPTPDPTAPASPSHPNIVFVLTDDLSWNLVKYMPNVLKLQRDGMTFTNYTVTDSLCCPSRASILTGDFPHNTHVVSNNPPNGGYYQFMLHHEQKSTYATSLAGAGYATGFMGKYLNGYDPQPTGSLSQVVAGAPVPPGWSTWNGVGNGYSEYNYGMADGHNVVRYGHKPSDYLTRVDEDRGAKFIRKSVRAHTPFFLEIATFAPHKPYTPAHEDLHKFPRVQAPRTPAFGHKPVPAPAWLVNHLALSAGDVRFEDKIFRQRVRSVQSVDRLIGHLREQLQKDGQAGNTEFVFSSDNGFHLGEYTLRQGKETAFDTDVRVPLIVAGPGIAPGSTNTHVVENVDLRPTFDALAGAPTPANVDGHSLVPLLHGENPPWRNLALVEHVKPVSSTADPDAQFGLDGNPPSYTAIRSASWIYVKYVTGDREYYNIATDPYELHNLGPGLPPARVATLDKMLTQLATCRGTTSCWDAASPRTS